MADRDEKIFPALPQKRDAPAKQGQIARSRDLTSAISFVAGTMFSRARLVLSHSSSAHFAERSR